MLEILKQLMWFIKSDVELETTTVFDLDNKRKIDGFYFCSKRRFSKSYQYHGVIGLENTYRILKLIQNSIKENRKAAKLIIHSGMGMEYVYIWNGSLKKAEKLMFDMIKEIQNQY